MNHSYHYRGRPAPRMTYPTCPLTPAEDTSRDMLCDNMVLAMSYVLIQPFEDVYEPQAGYPRGTIFAQLDKPFLAGGMGCD